MFNSFLREIRENRLVPGTFCKSQSLLNLRFTEYVWCQRKHQTRASGRLCPSELFAGKV